MLCIQRCCSANVGCGQWDFFCCCLSIISNHSARSDLWPLTPTRHFLAPTAAAHWISSLFAAANPSRTSAVCSERQSRLHHIYTPDCIELLPCDWQLNVGPNKVGGWECVRLLFFSLHVSPAVTWWPLARNENTSAPSNPGAGWAVTDKYCWAALRSSVVMIRSYHRVFKCCWKTPLSLCRNLSLDINMAETSIFSFWSRTQSLWLPQLCRNCLYCWWVVFFFKHNPVGGSVVNGMTLVDASSCTERLCIDFFFLYIVDNKMN